MIAPQKQEIFPRPFNENYDLIGALGKGGMGNVYKAMDKRLNRIVAFKILDASSDEEAIKRFYLEAQAMKQPAFYRDDLCRRNQPRRHPA